MYSKDSTCISSMRSNFLPKACRDSTIFLWQFTGVHPFTTMESCNGLFTCCNQIILRNTLVVSLFTSFSKNLKWSVTNMSDIFTFFSLSFFKNLFYQQIYLFVYILFRLNKHTKYLYHDASSDKIYESNESHRMLVFKNKNKFLFVTCFLFNSTHNYLV